MKKEFSLKELQNLSKEEKNNSDESSDEEEKKQTGKTDDPVRLYLRDMGAVELLSREGFEGISVGLQSLKGVGRLVEVYALKDKHLTIPNPDDYKENKVEAHSDNEVPSIAIIPFENNLIMSLLIILAPEIRPMSGFKVLIRLNDFSELWSNDLYGILNISASSLGWKIGLIEILVLNGNLLRFNFLFGAAII